MQYMILCAEHDAAFAERNDPTKAGAYWGAWGAYAQALQEAGIFVSGAGLTGPEAATTIRLRDGGRHVQDGPYADTKEQLGGFFIIEVPDLDTAMDWAVRSPSASYASVEVRPLLPPMG